MKTLIDCARLAPSAKNRQPWKFIIVTDTIKNQIADIVYTQKEIAKLVGYEDMELISAISIGYPNENPKQRPRKKLSEVLEWY